MALKKQKKSKGIIAEYWKIIERKWIAVENRTACVLALYVNKQARNEDIRNYLEVVNFSFTGELTREQLYLQIKQSALSENNEETNWFTDAGND